MDGEPGDLKFVIKQMKLVVTFLLWIWVISGKIVLANKLNNKNKK